METEHRKQHRIELSVYLYTFKDSQASYNKMPETTETTEMREKLEQELKQALQLERTFTVQVEVFLSKKHLRPTEEGVFVELLKKYKHYLLRRELLVEQGSLEECKDPSHEVEIERMRGKLFGMAHGTTKTKTRLKSTTTRPQHEGTLGS